MGLIGIVKDILIVYVGFRLLLVFLFGLEYNFHIFSFLLILFLLAVMGLLQRFGILPSHKSH